MIVLCSVMLSASSYSLREAFAEIVVRLISFIVNQAGAQACSSWNLQQPVLDLRECMPLG